MGVSDLHKQATANGPVISGAASGFRVILYSTLFPFPLRFPFRELGCFRAPVFNCACDSGEEAFRSQALYPLSWVVVGVLGGKLPTRGAAFDPQWSAGEK